MQTLYITDLDGTLLGADGRVSAESVRILAPMLRRGLPLTVATARSPATVVQLLQALPITLPAVLMTGTILYDLPARRTIGTQCLSAQSVAAMCGVLRREGAEALAYSAKGGQLYVYYKQVCCPFEEAFIAQRRGTPYKLFRQVPEYEAALAGGDTLMFLFCVPTLQRAEYLFRALDEVPGIVKYFYPDEYARGGYLLEVYPAGASKATAIEKVKAMTGAADIVSFGDNINDLPMFAASRISCAVANAAPEVRLGPASCVIGHHDEAAVARWLCEHGRVLIFAREGKAMQEIAQPLLRWFDENKRSLPFRAHKTPYRVWVSEVMLQQGPRVAAVLPYYERFMRELPTVQALAACPPEKLAKLWEGLGYYSRARNLQRAAQAVVEQYGGELPASYEALRALPGIGDYTAGAVASLAFGLPYAAVDGNVLRVWSRLHADDADISAATKRRMAAEVQAAQPAQRPGDFNEALMELGALVCLPNGEPLCGNAPGAASAWPENRAGRPCCRLRRRAKRARRFAIRKDFHAGVFWYEAVAAPHCQKRCTAGARCRCGRPFAAPEQKTSPQCAHRVPSQ